MPTTKDGHTDIVWSRVDAIVQLILDNPRYLGSRRQPELTKIVMERFGISERTAQRSLKEAKKVIREITKKDIKKNFKRAILDREFLWQKAKNNDYRTALEVARDRDKLLGLYEEKVLLTGEMKITFIENVDD
jgi:hypothetical protein